jgi:xanthine/CO dehydrogenase XdhC/CoxF family maturation factor
MNPARRGLSKERDAVGQDCGATVHVFPHSLSRERYQIVRVGPAAIRDVSWKAL